MTTEERMEKLERRAGPVLSVAVIVALTSLLVSLSTLWMARSAAHAASDVHADSSMVNRMRRLETHLGNIGTSELERRVEEMGARLKFLESLSRIESTDAAKRFKEAHVCQPVHSGGNLRASGSGLARPFRRPHDRPLRPPEARPAAGRRQPGSARSWNNWHTRGKWSSPLRKCGVTSCGTIVPVAQLDRAPVS